MNATMTLDTTIAQARELVARKPDLNAFIAAAVRAPSGDNLQPWHFVAHETTQRIDVYCDAARDPSPLNAGQRMSHIACGAAIENILLLAHEQGWQIELETAEHIAPEDTGPIARIHFAARTQRGNKPHAASLIATRVTNRRLYDRRTIDATVVQQLVRATPPLEGTSTAWFTLRPQINTLAGVISRADAVMFGEPAFRNAFLANVRFDLPAAAQADSGLPLHALELSRIDRVALKTLQLVPDALLKITGGAQTFAAHARKLVDSASGLCIVCAPENMPATELQIGRAMQRAWLVLTDLGLAAQPMMSLPVLDNALQHGAPSVFANGPAPAQELLAESRATLQRLGIAARPGFILRFGYAAAPTGRTGRRDVTVCSETVQ